MDELIILSKIDALNRCLKRIRDKRPSTVESLLADLDLQDIIILNLERAVQLSVDIAAYVLAELEVRPPQTMGESFSRLEEEGVISPEVSLRMQKSVGFRNIAVHEYQTLSYQAVFTIITNHLEDFENFAGEVIQWNQNPKTDKGLGK